MIYLLIIFIIILLIIPIKVKIYLNLEGYLFKIYNITIYKKKYKEISDINKERKNINKIKIFKIIDIKAVNLELCGINDYYYRAINYGGVYILFNLISFYINDQFIFNYKLDFYGQPKLNFECIIKSNLGKIIIGLLRRRN